jgi:hypothetical protein
MFPFTKYESLCMKSFSLQGDHPHLYKTFFPNSPWWIQVNQLSAKYPLRMNPLFQCHKEPLHYDTSFSAIFSKEISPLLYNSNIIYKECCTRFRHRLKIRFLLFFYGVRRMIGCNNISVIKKCFKSPSLSFSDLIAGFHFINVPKRL